MLRYILLTATWVFLVVLVIHLWLIRGGEPPVPLLAILAIISLIPLATRLKIGNWLDFTKKLDHLNTEVSSNREQIRQVSSQLTSVSNLVHTIVTSKQSQQQWNIALSTEEAAKAFASVTLPSIKKVYPPSGTKTTSNASLKRLYFLWAADETLALAIPSLWALHSFRISLDEHRRTKGEEILGEKLVSIIERLQDLKLPAGVEEREDFKTHLQSIQTLFKAREDVDRGNTKPPSVKKARKLLEEAHTAALFLAGAVSVVPYGLLEGIRYGLRIPYKQTELEQKDKSSP